MTGNDRDDAGTDGDAPGSAARQATVSEIADHCGIEPSGTEIDLVPVRQYRERGRVDCADCGEQPDPPWLVVAAFDDEKARCHECYALDLPLPDDESEVYALYQAGWRVKELQQQFSPLGRRKSDAPELLRAAQEKMP